MTGRDPLTAADIRREYGDLLAEGVAAFREDPMLLVEMIESHSKSRRNIARAQAARAKPRPTVVERPSDEWLREAYDSGRPTSEVAASLGVNLERVRAWWLLLGLHASDRPRSMVRAVPRVRGAQEQRERLVRQHFADGLTTARSAEILGISRTGCAGIRKRLGLAS